MVILFITSGLEPGRDGVGDYTRLLAAECIRQGHSSLLMSLNDPYVSQPTESLERIDEVSIPTLRIPEIFSWERKTALAVEFRARYSIDWISLQFVLYGFHFKGIVRNKAPYFEQIIGEYPLHVMFHETWIGTGKKPPLKHRIVGPIQRYYIQKLFRRLKPRLVTTSNLFYVSHLQGIGFSAVETPLFSNITPTPMDGDRDIPPTLIQAKICDEQGHHPDYYVGLFFGALYPEWKAEPFMSLFASALKKSGRRPCLISAGRPGGHGTAVLKELQAQYGDAVKFIVLGECTSRQVSSLMHMADFGLAATPWYLLGKSSTTATMLDHGLPVVVTNYDFQPVTANSRPDDPLLHRCDASLEDKLWAGLPRRPVRRSIDALAKKLTGLFAESAPTTQI